MSYENPDDKFSGLSGNAELTALNARCEEYDFALTHAKNKIRDKDVKIGQLQTKVNCLTREFAEAWKDRDMWKSQWTELDEKYWTLTRELEEAKAFSAQVTHNYCRLVDACNIDEDGETPKLAKEIIYLLEKNKSLTSELEDWKEKYYWAIGRWNKTQIALDHAKELLGKALGSIRYACNEELLSEITEYLRSLGETKGEMS